MDYLLMKDIPNCAAQRAVCLARVHPLAAKPPVTDHSLPPTHSLTTPSPHSSLRSPKLNVAFFFPYMSPVPQQQQQADRRHCRYNRYSML